MVSLCKSFFNHEDGKQIKKFWTFQFRGRPQKQPREDKEKLKYSEAMFHENGNFARKQNFVYFFVGINNSRRFQKKY